MPQITLKNESYLLRVPVFVVYFWFGLLKTLSLSPAGPLVEALHSKTIPFIPFTPFYISFSVFEMLVGVMFLVKGSEKLAFILLCLHLFTTTLPLLLLPDLTWQNFLTPSLEGQYIIKNILLLSLGTKIFLDRKKTA